MVLDIQHGAETDAYLHDPHILPDINDPGSVPLLIKRIPRSHYFSRVGMDPLTIMVNLTTVVGTEERSQRYGQWVY